MLKDYKGDAAVAAGEAFDATPANIEARTQRYKTADGMNVALMPKRTRGGTVNARLTIRMGDEKSLQGSAPAGSVVASMLNRGAGGMTRTQIQDAFDKLKARVNFGASEPRLVVTMETTRDNLPQVMALVAKLVRTPDFPAAELEVLRNERIAEVESQRKEPEWIGRINVARHGSPYKRGDPRYFRTFEESIEDMRALTLERVRAFHRDFYGSDNAELAVVGDFDPAALRTQLASLFGGWKAAKPYTRLPSPLYSVPSVDLRVETPDKANAYFTAQSRFPLRDDAPDYAAALVAERFV
jgi:zinc protease